MHSTPINNNPLQILRQVKIIYIFVTEFGLIVKQIFIGTYELHTLYSTFKIYITTKKNPLEDRLTPLTLFSLERKSKGRKE